MNYCKSCDLLYENEHICDFKILTEMLREIVEDDYRERQLRKKPLLQISKPLAKRQITTQNRESIRNDGKDCCDNCGEWIPRKNIRYHESRCGINNL